MHVNLNMYTYDCVSVLTCHAPVCMHAFICVYVYAHEYCIHLLTCTCTRDRLQKPYRCVVNAACLTGQVPRGRLDRRKLCSSTTSALLSWYVCVCECICVYAYPCVCDNGIGLDFTKISPDSADSSLSLVVPCLRVAIPLLTKSRLEGDLIQQHHAPC